MRFVLLIIVEGVILDDVSVFAYDLALYIALIAFNLVWIFALGLAVIQMSV